MLDLGASPKATIRQEVDIPVIAYAIMSATELEVDSTDIVATLLVYGADPHSVPSDMWKDYMTQPNVDAPPSQPIFSSSSSDRQFDALIEWCKPRFRKSLAQSFNLTQRYHFWKASSIKDNMAREQQYAIHHELTALLQMPYHIIGQEYAIEQIKTKIHNHRVAGQRTPLILAFAGPSGHGKTKAARSLGMFLKLPIQICHCTSLRHETDLFGPKKPYQGWDIGTPLNSFLRHQSGKRSIVFLDEFEKTEKDVWNALLKIIDKGTYNDGTASENRIDCKDTIWVFATNLVDPLIKDFYIKHLKGKPKDQLRLAPFESLQQGMRGKMKDTFEHALTGCIRTFVPFIPFNPDEAAVIAHKYCRRIAARARKDFNMQDLRIGRINLVLKDDGAACKTIADEEHDMDTGARSIGDAVRNLVEEPLVEAFLNESRLVCVEMNAEPRTQYCVHLITEGEEKEIIVTKGKDLDADVDSLTMAGKNDKTGMIQHG